MTANTVTLASNYGYDQRIRVFRCGQLVDSFAILTARFLILVDTMDSPESMQQVMNALQDDWDPAQPESALLVVNTHGDWDHVWGNDLFIGPDAQYPAPVIGHRLTAEGMVSATTIDFLATFQADHPGEYQDATFTPPTVLFDGRLRIDGGDLTLELIHAPGHTDDHCIVWIPEIRTILGGDAVEFPLPLVHDAQDVPVLRASLARLLALGADTVLCCHAPGSASPTIIDHNIAYFEQLEHHCRQTLRHAAMDRMHDPVVFTDWPLERALPPGTLISDLEQPEFYRRFHASNTKAMLEWITAGADHPDLNPSA